MFISKTLIQIPAKTLVEDLVSRSGYPNSESLSPYQGKYDEIRRDLANIAYDGSVSAMFSSQPDYDADKQKPYEGAREDSDDDMCHEYATYNASGEIESEYPRRLEDIHPSHVIHYLYNVAYGVKYNASNSIRSYNKDNPTTKTLIGNEEEVVEEKDLLLNTDDSIYTQQEIHEAKTKVPYLIRKLHDKSIELGVHLISLLIAYERAKEVVNVSNYVKKNNITVRPRHLLAEGVYAMGSDGNIAGLFEEDANKNSRAFMRGRDWLSEPSDTRKDANELVHCYEVLGIDIKTEDPATYVQSYVDKLVISYVTSNVDYVMRKNDSIKQKMYTSFGYMKNISKKLRDLPLETYTEYANIQQVQDEDIADNAIRIYIDSPNFSETEKFRYEYSTVQEQTHIDIACARFVDFYNQIVHTTIDLRKYHCCDGFFYSRDDKPLVLDMTGFITDPLYSTLCLLNSNGYLVACAVDICTQYVDVFDMCEHLSDYMSGIVDLPMRWKMFSL